MVEVKMWIQEY